MASLLVKILKVLYIFFDIVKNDIQKTALKTACPHGVHLSILTAKGAARRINSGKYQGQTVLIFNLFYINWYKF